MLNRKKKKISSYKIRNAYARIIWGLNFEYCQALRTSDIFWDIKTKP